MRNCIVFISLVSCSPLPTSSFPASFLSHPPRLALLFVLLLLLLYIGHRLGNALVICSSLRLVPHFEGRSMSDAKTRYRALLSISRSCWPLLRFEERRARAEVWHAFMIARTRRRFRISNGTRDGELCIERLAQRAAM